MNLIFMLESPMYNCIQETKEEFVYLDHEMWPQTCGQIVFKFNKKQTKSENYENCNRIMISYVIFA